MDEIKLITVTLREGGRDEFERTGKYHKSLSVDSDLYDQRWILDIPEEEIVGSLKIGQKEVYRYIITSETFKLFDVDFQELKCEYEKIMMD